MMSVVGRSMPRSDLAWCRKLTRRRAGNFYWGLRLLPEPKRSALYAVYAWMRRVDDIVDDALETNQAEHELDLFSEQTTSLLSGSWSGDHPMWRALHWVAQEWPLPSEAFSDMIRGQKRDLQAAPMTSSDELIDYCQCVASTVGRVCVSIWGGEGDGLMDRAAERGIAMQLTNILRDVGADASQGRCYLPSDDLRRYGLDVGALVGWSRPESCQAIINHWIDVATQHYESSAVLDHMVEKDCRQTLRAMTGIYRALLEQVRLQPVRSVSVPGVSLSLFEKIRIGLRSRRS